MSDDWQGRILPVRFYDDGMGRPEAIRRLWALPKAPTSRPSVVVRLRAFWAAWVAFWGRLW